METVVELEQWFKSFALGRLKRSTYFELGDPDDPSFLRKRLPIRWKVPDLDFDGENMSNAASLLVGVRGSSTAGFVSGSGLLNMLPHLSHLSAMKAVKNKTDFILQSENS